MLVLAKDFIVNMIQRVAKLMLCIKNYGQSVIYKITCNQDMLGKVFFFFD